MYVVHETPHRWHLQFFSLWLWLWPGASATAVRLAHTFHNFTRRHPSFQMTE